MNMNLSAYDVEKHLQRPNQTAVIAPNGASLPSKTSAVLPTNGLTFARNAASHSPKASDGTRRGTVGNGVATRPKSDGNDTDKASQHNVSVPPLNRGYVIPPIVGNCDHCGSELTRKSRNGRFPKYCNANCRQRAFRARQRTEKGRAES